MSASVSGRETASLSRRWLTAGALLFALCVPLLLVATNVLDVAGDLDFYQREFARYDVARVTGLTASQLRDVAARFNAFFGGARDALDAWVDVGGRTRPLFGPRELAHMDDVYRLMAGVRWARILAGAALLGFVLVGFARHGYRFLHPLGLSAVAGGASTLVLLVALGVLALSDFGDAFVQFHLLAFDNDLWILDPSRDYLIMLFPEGFWFDATLRIATLAALEAAAFIGGGAILLLASRRQ